MWSDEQGEMVSLPVHLGEASPPSLSPSAPERDGPVVTMCGHGERAATAASTMGAAGRDGAAILDGGPEAREPVRPA